MPLNNTRILFHLVFINPFFHSFQSKSISKSAKRAENLPVDREVVEETTLVSSSSLSPAKSSSMKSATSLNNTRTVKYIKYYQIRNPLTEFIKWHLYKYLGYNCTSEKRPNANDNYFISIFRKLTFESFII